MFCGNGAGTSSGFLADHAANQIWLQFLAFGRIVHQGIELGSRQGRTQFQERHAGNGERGHGLERSQRGNRGGRRRGQVDQLVPEGPTLRLQRAGH